MRYSVCIEMIGKEVPFSQRLKLVKQAGYDAVEFWGWQTKDLQAITEAAADNNIQIAGMVGSAGKLLDPAMRPSLLQDLEKSLEVAAKLSCKTLIVTTGNEIAGVSRAAQLESIIAGLKAAAPMAEQAGVMLVLEPLNALVDHKGYFLNTSTEGFAIIRQVGSPYVRLLFDIYHQQITEGNISANIVANIDLIGHFHVADVPGRHEPGTGELNYCNIISTISSTGYTGYLGLEYLPLDESVHTLRKWQVLVG